MADPTQCGKCGGGMEQGFVLDFEEGRRRISRWAPGQPQRSFWMGTKLPEGVLPIGTFRCSGCGYLESYADPRFDAE